MSREGPRPSVTHRTTGGTETFGPEDVSKPFLFSAVIESVTVMSLNSSLYGKIEESLFRHVKPRNVTEGKKEEKMCGEAGEYLYIGLGRLETSRIQS